MVSNSVLGSLSFAQTSENGKTNLWAPGEDVSYERQAEAGRARARELITYMRDADNPTVFGHVIAAIAAAGQHTGMEIGFYHVVGEHLL